MLYGILFIIIGALLQNPRAIIAGTIITAIAAWYRKTHRRSALSRLSGNDKPLYVRKPISEATRHEVWRRDQGRCVDCGSRERLEYDHVIPIIKGGSNTTRNIELRCETCNRRKGARI